MKKKLKKILFWTGIGALTAGVIYWATRPYEMTDEEQKDYDEAMALAKEYDAE